MGLHAIVERIKQPVNGATASEGKDALLVNEDLLPLKLKDRKWNAWTYLCFWFSAVATVGAWYASSPGQALGLGIWDNLGLQLAGQILIAVVLAANGRSGAVYHVGFPVVNRAAFGIFGAFWPTFNRAIMAVVWNGVNTVQGGQCVYVMLHALFPSIKHIPNIMGEGSSIKTGEMIGLLVFWSVTCCWIAVPIPKMRRLVYVKFVVFLVSAITMSVWTVSKAGGLGPIVRQGPTIEGSELFWLRLRFFLLGAANAATFATNAPDYQRYVTKPSDVTLGNLIGFPFSQFVVAIAGNFVCAASQQMFGELLWNPLDVLDRIQTEDYSAANRAGCFFIAACFVYSVMFSCIFENYLPAGNDIAALFPKYISIQRGMCICAVLSLAINPWYLLGSAEIFVRFMSSYQTWLCAVTGVLLVNYYAIARGKLHIPDCFTSSPTGVYYYFNGWNLRAYAAYVIGILPNVWGFANNLGADAPLWVTRAYYFAYWIGLLLSGLTFYAASVVWPPRVMETGWKEAKNYVRPDEDPEQQQDDRNEAKEAELVGDEREAFPKAGAKARGVVVER